MALARGYAGTSGGTIGVDERAYPQDAASTLRYQPALARLPGRYPLPPPLTAADVDDFLSQPGPAARGPVRIDTLSTGG